LVDSGVSAAYPVLGVIPEVLVRYYGAMLLAVVGWYTAPAFGVVHSFYVFAP
jgi:hypothetical protein